MFVLQGELDGIMVTNYGKLVLLRLSSEYGDDSDEGTRPRLACQWDYLRLNLNTDSEEVIRKGFF